MFKVLNIFEKIIFLNNYVDLIIDFWFVQGYGSFDSFVGDSIEYVESVQRIVIFLGVIFIDIQDSVRYDDVSFLCGNIYFWIGQMNMEESSVSVVGLEYFGFIIFIGVCKFYLF